jgi:hypothetical protein
MATHYPHVGADENKPGLHYSGFSAVIHKRGSDLQRKNFSGSAKSAANPRSWANDSPGERQSFLSSRCFTNKQ